MIVSRNYVKVAATMRHLRDSCCDLHYPAWITYMWFIGLTFKEKKEIEPFFQFVTE